MKRARTETGFMNLVLLTCALLAALLVTNLPLVAEAQTLYGISRDGDVFTIDVNTGVGTPVGALLVVCVTEIEYDNSTNRAYAQICNGFFEGQEFDIDTLSLIGGPIPTDGVLNGIECVGDTCYATRIFSPGGFPSDLLIADLFNGGLALIGPTGINDPISGLAYDEVNEIMYGIKGGPGPAPLYIINLKTGLATPVGDTGIQAGSLQFGPDGNLYAGGTGPNSGDLFQIDPATGASTLVGPTGFSSVTGLTLVGQPTTETKIDITAVPNPATVGGPLDIFLDLDNSGPGFDAKFRLWVFADGNVTTLLSISPFVSSGLVLTGVNIFSTASVPAGLPPAVGFLAAIFNAASGELLDSDFESVGIGVAPSAADIAALRQTATNFLNSGDLNAAPPRPEEELNFNGTAKNPFEQRVNIKEKLTTTWGRIKSQR